jgi:hypothetical protein
MAGFEDAIQARVKAALTFDGGHVIWANQTRDRPSRPFVELALLTDDDLSEQGEYSQEDNPDSTGNDGEEILLNVKHQVELTVQFRVFSSAVTGANRAFNLAKRVRDFFDRESTIEALGAIAVISRDNVQDASIVLETEHEGRAVFNIRFRVADIDTETATYIETVKVKPTVIQTDGPIESTITIDLGD